MFAVLNVLQVKTSAGLKKRDDDWFDRLSSRYTVVLLVSFAVVTTMTHMIREPIQCWCDAHFPRSWIKYANNYCWVNSTYYLPYSENIPAEPSPESYIRYYQWIPFILLAQAMCFYLPSMVWHQLNQKSGVDSDDILETVMTLDNLQETASRTKIMRLLTGQLNRFIEKYRRQDAISSEDDGRVIRILDSIRCEFGGYLSVLYVFTKFLYIANIIFQYYLLNIIFPGYITFGLDYFTKFSHNYYETNAMFPRHTMCNVLMRILGNVQRYTVQCVLPINMIIEKEYLFLWYWMAVVGTVAVVSLFTWIIKLIHPRVAESFLLNHMWRGSFRNYTSKKELTARDGYGDELKALQDEVRPFRKALGSDAYFLLQLIAHNTNAVTTTDVIDAVYTAWKEDDSPHDLIRSKPNGETKGSLLKRFKSNAG